MQIQEARSCGVRVHRVPRANARIPQAAKRAHDFTLELPRQPPPLADGGADRSPVEAETQLQLEHGSSVAAVYDRAPSLSRGPRTALFASRPTADDTLAIRIQCGGNTASSSSWRGSPPPRASHTWSVPSGPPSQRPLPIRTRAGNARWPANGHAQTGLPFHDLHTAELHPDAFLKTLLSPSALRDSRQSQRDLGDGGSTTCQSGVRTAHLCRHPRRAQPHRAGLSVGPFLSNPR